LAPSLGIAEKPHPGYQIGSEVVAVHRVVDLVISSKDVVELTIISISLCTHPTSMKGVSTIGFPIILLVLSEPGICLSALVACETYFHRYLPECQLD
jgi:hypothetical protein